MQEKRKFYSCPITLFDKNEIRVTPFVGVTLIILVLSQFVQPLTYNLVVGIFIVSDCSTTSCVFDFLLRCTPL